MTKDFGMSTESTRISQRSQNRGLQRQRVGGGSTPEQLCSHWTYCKLHTLGRKREGEKTAIFLESTQSTEGKRKRMCFIVKEGRDSNLGIEHKPNPAGCIMVLWGGQSSREKLKAPTLISLPKLSPSRPTSITDP